MTTRMIAVAVEVVVAILFLVAAVLCWSNGVQTTEFASVGDIPGFTATYYAGPWLVLAVGSVAITGLVVLDAISRTLRAKRVTHSG